MLSMSREVGKKQNITRNRFNRTLTGMTVPFVPMAWNVITKYCLREPLEVFIELYMCFSHALLQFQILSQRLNGFLSQNTACIPF